MTTEMTTVGFNLFIFGFILFIYGLAKAFFGYKWYRLSLFFTGFFAGAAVGGIIGAASGGAAAAFTAGLALGILCGILNVILLKVGIFIQCFVYGFMAVMIPSIISQLIEFANVNRWLNVVMNLLNTGSTGVNLFSALPAALVAGLAAGILGVIISRVLIILTTGMFGGMIGGAGFCMMVSHFSPAVLIITAVIIAVPGIIVQMKTTGKGEKESASTVNKGISENSSIGVMAGASMSTNPAAGKGEGLQAQASQTMGIIKENGEKALGAARRRGEEGIDSIEVYHNNAVNNALSFEANLSWEEIFKAMEKSLFQNAVMSWAMPFIEVITVAIALLILLFSVMGAGAAKYYIISYMEFGTPLFLAACLLGVIQRKHIYVFCVLGMEVLINLFAVFIRKPYYIILVLFYAGLTVLYVFYYRNISKEKIKFPNMIPYGNKTANANSTASFVQTVNFCGKCGNKASKNTRFCAKCGNKIL